MTDKWMPLEYRAGEARGAAEPPTFNDIADAFDYCREADKPIKAVVDGVCYKLFPSGYSEKHSKEVVKCRSHF